MLWTLGVILLVLWALGLVSGYTMGAVFVKTGVAFSYAALADFEDVFVPAGGFNQTLPI
jgi:hypothetical protein